MIKLKWFLWWANIIGAVVCLIVIYFIGEFRPWRDPDRVYSWDKWDTATIVMALLALVVGFVGMCSLIIE